MNFTLGRAGGQDLRCDLEQLIRTRLLVQANSGAGKSWCLRRILEQTHGRVQQLIIDPEGEFSSLREKFDYVLAAKHGGDTVADPRAAKLLAERLLELRASAILDIYELKHDERIRFVRLFLEALINSPKRLWHETLVVIDEAHTFAPEKAGAESVGAVIDLAARGRKRGFCPILATQRIAKLAKDAAAELNNKLIGRTGLDVDMKRVADELGLSKADWPTLRSLGDGEFFAFGPAISREVVQVKVGSVQTHHPKAGGKLSFTAPPPTARIKALLPKLADLPAEAEEKARTEADLRREISGLKRQLAEKPAPAAAPPTKLIEVPVITAHQVERIDRFAGKVSETGQALFQLGKEIVAALQGAGVRNGHQKQLPAAREVTAAAPVAGRRDTPPRRATTPAPDGEAFPPAAQKILDSIAELEGMGVRQPERIQVAFMSGYTNLTSKGMANGLGSLRTAGLIDYAPGGRVFLTEAGQARANPPEQARTPKEIQERVVKLLGGACGKVLSPLIDSYPQSAARQDLASAAGYGNLTSKGFANILGRLRSLGFIDYPSPGQVCASPVLFLEDRRS